MQEIIQLEDQFYILTTSPRVDDRTCVLKHGETFAVFDRFGDISPLGRGDQGLYHRGTRFISHLNLTVCGQRPLLLGATIHESNMFLNSDLTNPDVRDPAQGFIPRGSVHIFRSKLIWEGICYERLRLSNFSLMPLRVPISLQAASDFADIFEVRGSRRAKKGKLLPIETTSSEVAIRYEGLDGTTRCTRIRCSPEPHQISTTRIEFIAQLKPKEDAVFLTTTSCEISNSPAPAPLPYERIVVRAHESLQSAEEEECQVKSSNPQFNQWLQRSIADLRSMATQTPFGAYPYAGIPWFSTPFGRDGILTALQMLWFNPMIAKGVLAYLAATQATEIDPEHDAEPGKILHEAREGEMAALSEIPFGRYYGSVDATPLFVILAGAYFERTGDRAFLQSLWPNVLAALQWADTYGDADNDGFIEYARRSTRGLQQQGWKDSHDSVFHSDGAIAEGPIALVEVQAYLYLAKRKAAFLAQQLGDATLAQQLREQADRLQKRFEQTFWSNELETYVLALDGNKKPCRVRSSNAGHCLFAGIADPERARKVAKTLLTETSFSGWGIRTLDSCELRYNPMSYHNGSVWPHDNAMIAVGFWRYGLHREALDVANSLFDLSNHVELARLPELICGFRRRVAEGPTLYPTACSPQAWAAGSVLMLLSTFLGLTLDGSMQQIRFLRPRLPSFLKDMVIKHLRIGDAALTVRIHGQEQDVDVHIEREKGSVEALVYK